jgi:hypothetical protein
MPVIIPVRSQIATAMGVSEGVVSQWMTRGLESLCGKALMGTKYVNECREPAGGLGSRGAGQSRSLGTVKTSADASDWL